MTKTLDIEEVLDDVFDKSLPKLILLPNTNHRMFTDIPNLFIETLQYYPQEKIDFIEPIWLEFDKLPSLDFISSLWILDINTVGMYQNNVFYQGQILNHDGLTPVEYALIVRETDSVVKRLNINTLFSL
jgi:hypothetical protein